MGYHDWLLQRYYSYRRWVPARFLYHADYFRVRRLLAGDSPRQGAAAAQRLRHILGTAVAHVPFYRRTVRLSAAQLANEAPLDLLQCFPPIDKAQVMVCQRDFLDERFDPRRLHYATSGGSSGQGIGMWRNKRLADIEKAFFAHEWAQFGFSAHRSRTLRIGADARRRAHEGPARVVGNRLMLSPYHLIERHRAAIVDAIARFRPQYVHAYPSSAAALAELVEPDRLRLRLAVRAVLLASEPATRQQLAAIVGLFGCPVSINYGLTERTGLAFATHWRGVTSSYRFEPLYALHENMAALGGNDGVAGNQAHEIVGTSLWNELMPLIRYRSGDFGALDGGGFCHAIDGRAQEFLVSRDGNRIPGLSIVIDEATWDFVRLYQVRQRAPGAITLYVVGRAGRLSAAQKQFVLAAQLRRWGGWFDIGIEEVEDIPLAANGKRQLVVNEMANDGVIGGVNDGS
jgi:phenylacetate-CoA ligase